jgi:hypothetical protein
VASYFSNFNLAAGIINIQHLHSLQRDLMQRVVMTVESSAKKATPVRTGHLRRSVTGAVRGVREGIVGSNLIYAPIVHRTNPYLDIGYANASSQLDGLYKWFVNELVDNS